MALEDYKNRMLRDSRCSYCKWIPFAQVKSWRYSQGCPSTARYNFHAYSASGRSAIGLSLLENRIDYSDEQLLDIIYKCQMCGSCDIACKMCRYDMEPLDMMRELRCKLVEDGQLLPQNMPVIDNLREENTMILEAKKADRGKWAEGLDVKDLTKEKAKVVFHAGCRFCYDKDLWKIARGAVTLLKNAGVDVGIMRGDENCCGGRANELGYRSELVKFAESNVEDWNRAGVKTVVTACSDGYFTFKRLYPAVIGPDKFKFEVLHVTELIDRLIKEGKIKFKKSIPMTVTYHDPCHLGRLGEAYIPWYGVEKKILGQVITYDPPKPRHIGINGIYEPPRDILRSIPGLNLVEMERNREYAWCCGAGGGVIDAYPDFALWTGGERIEEAKATGAKAIVTACPWCERSFLDVINAKGEKMQVYDVVELVQQAI